MKLADALDLSNRLNEHPTGATRVWLICGFTPLHLSTFFKAHAHLRLAEQSVEVITGRFGDLAGNIERAIEQPVGETAVVLEWTDFDPRLGLRGVGGWSVRALPDIEFEVKKRLAQFGSALDRLSQKSLIALSGPTLPLPPLAYTSAAQETAFELRLRAMTESFLAEAAQNHSIRILSQAALDVESPVGQRLDVGLELAAGFPYTLRHADAVADLLVQLLFPPQPKKGLITDLDDTLWHGLVGEDGVESVTWDLQHHAQHHGVYQQFLAALAERGILIGIASKNDPALAMQALERLDILIPPSALCPIELNWEPKSASVERILRAWNIGARDVVFVDDSPMERSEVQAAFPEITCLAFPGAASIWGLLLQLRGLFGKPEILAEDWLRASSIRANVRFQQEYSHPSSRDFLSNVCGTISIDFSKNPKDRRALELVNKTTQFNLNGRRYTEGEWLTHLSSKNSFLATLSYEDKFGSLGKIAVATGSCDGDVIRVRTWVMSCRAFSRRIEHHMLESLFTHFDASKIECEYKSTGRNGPFREFFEGFLDSVPASGILYLMKSDFAIKRPSLPHKTKEVTGGSGCRPSSEMLL